MTDFFKSFAPLLKKSKKYLLEIVLLTVAVIITITALFLYVNNDKQAVGVGLDRPSTEVPQISSTAPSKIFVDVSGAVKKPNIYQIDFGARLKDAVDKAGGLSDEADTVFFNRNFNLARTVSDQEKIYVPSIVEINNGIFVQNQRTLDYVSPSTGDVNIAPTDVQTPNLGVSTKINLNSATIEELDQLPGVGQTTADKIIKNRPYASIEELLTKKVINKNVYEKIKGLISIN
ncbi:helix-hairpin-helix domain-containing protein [Candidatus Roizmanbacteria bacterium]|nr:helix-hairpin-helix domain-containing protein [Candidatus Roizmanbacteria bacterium]